MKRSILKTLSLGIAAGAIALCNPQIQAQADEAMSTMTSSAPSTPMPASGTVQRYYVDRTGYVTAMDVQTADGVKMIHFPASMAANLTSMYPVGSTASVYVTSRTWGTKTRYDLAGATDTMPAPNTIIPAMMFSDVDVLKSPPMTTIGAKIMHYKGKVTSAITDPRTGEVLALVLDNKTLLRMPVETRQIQASPAPEGITPLMKGADVAAYGYPEAPRYGSVSPYAEHVVATSVSVNGMPVGPLGFGKIKRAKNDTLFGFDIPFFSGSIGIDKNATEIAPGMGYMPYEAPAM